MKLCVAQFKGENVIKIKVTKKYLTCTGVAAEIWSITYQKYLFSFS